MGDKPIWETFELTSLNNLKKDQKLFNYQQYAVYLSLNKVSFVNGLQTGLGKTVCAYATYYYYKQKYPNTKLIVVSNKSAVLQMQEQLYKFFEVNERGAAVHRFMDKLKGEKYATARRRVFKSFGEIESDSLDMLWMNYSIFRRDFGLIEAAVKSLKIKGLKVFTIYDESTAFMNMGTDTFKSVRKISRMADRICALTATVSKGKLEQIYSIFKAMGIDLFTSKEDFMNRYCIVWQHPKKWYIKKIKGYQNVQELVNLVRSYIIVLRKVDVASQLPPFTISKTYLEQSEAQIKLINDIYTGELDVTMYKGRGDNLRVTDREGNIGSHLKGSIETNFIKLALLDERLIGRPNKIDHKVLSPKTEELIRMLDEDCIDEKIIVYTHSKKYLKLIAETVRKHKHVPDFYKKTLEIHGDIDMLDRNRFRKVFTDSNDHNIMFINQAGIESLNLQAANTIVISTMPVSCGDLIQLAGRISRIDTKHKNLYLKFLLMKDSQDEDEYRIIMEQLLIISGILDEAEEGLLDWDILQGFNKDTVSKEEYLHKSLSYFILRNRSRRERLYRKLLCQLN